MNGIVGGILHIFCHAVMKSLLFLAAGAIIFKTGIRKIEDLAGMGYRMPLTMAAFSIGALFHGGDTGIQRIYQQVLPGIRRPGSWQASVCSCDTAQQPAQCRVFLPPLWCAPFWP